MATRKPVDADLNEPVAKPDKSAFLQSMSGEGFENMGPESLAIPRLSVAQQMSAALDRTKPGFVKGAQMGDFVLSLPPTNLGKEIDVVVLHYACWWVEWPAQRGGAPIAHHVPGSIPVDMSDYREWFHKTNGNKIVETHDFVVGILGHEDVGPCMLNLTSTGVKTAKTWNTLLAMQRMSNGAQLPLFGGVWKMTSGVAQNQQGTWATINTPVFTGEITEKYFKSTIAEARAKAKIIAVPSLEYTPVEQIEAPAPQRQISQRTDDNKDKISY
jgi:hypothetical protein